MTPQERKLIEDLFERLASLENQTRDADAVQAINEGLRRAPNALYPLVQTVLVQDEALKRADARIRELENELGVDTGQPAQAQPGFLDTMRDALLGRSSSQGQGSVPSVRPGAERDAGAGRESPWRNTGQQGGYAPQPGYGQPPQPGYGQPAFGGGGSSFLGTAAAAAAGVVGGSLLMNSFRGMFGQPGQHQAFGDVDRGSSGSPWESSSNSELARDAGVNDIGNRDNANEDRSQQAGLFDAPDPDGADFDDDSFDVGGDFEGGGDDNA